MSEILRPLVAARGPRYREAAYEAIKEAILSGGFEPGRPVMEEKIAAALQISRTPVREALAILEHEELIGPRGGRGLHVRELTREEYVEMYVANEAVEPYLARQAAARASEERLAEIEAAIVRGRESAERHDVAGFLRSGRDFHRLVGEAAGNAPLTHFIGRNEERADLYLLGSGTGPDRQSMDASNREHGDILAAIRRRDPDAAARLTIYHSQSLRKRFAPLFASEEEALEAPAGA
jgi:DNA-binding GntR family transcriptional regulator